MERLRPDRTLELTRVDQEILDRIGVAYDRLVEEGLNALLERKRAGVAVHWRGAQPVAGSIAKKVQKVWASLSSRKGLRLLRFNQGM